MDGARIMGVSHAKRLTKPRLFLLNRSAYSLSHLTRGLFLFCILSRKKKIDKRITLVDGIGVCGHLLTCSYRDALGGAACPIRARD